MTERQPAHPSTESISHAGDHDEASSARRLEYRSRVDIFHHSVTAWLVLAASLVLTVAAWQIANKYAQQRAQSNLPEFVAAAGFGIDLLLFAIIWSISGQRRRALAAARIMTAELRESARRLDLAIEGSGLALFDWDLAKDSIYLSSQWSIMLGGPAQESAMRPVALIALVHPQDLAAVQKLAAEVVRGQRAEYYIEHRVRTREGQWKWILSKGKVAERDRAGRATRLTGTNADIDARKALERMKNDVIVVVNHELRTPLTALMGALDIVVEEKELTDVQRERFLRIALQNAGRLAALIDDNLDSARLEARTMPYRFVPLDVPVLLERAVELNEGYAMASQVRFHIDSPLPDVRIRADYQRALQVMTNLMSNAVKHTSAGGVVHLAASRREDRVRISVIDHGPGVPVAFGERIFQKFARANSSDARVQGGMGLGLSIAKAIVEERGGTIGFDSKPGAGATFYFDLPIIEESPTVQTPIDAGPGEASTPSVRRSASARSLLRHSAKAD